jgi:hypothetical protein
LKDPFATNRLQLLLEVAFDTTSPMRQWPNKQSIKYNPYEECPFLGEELIKHGMHTIVLSWSSCEDWKGGETLYYTPKVLHTVLHYTLYSLCTLYYTPKALSAPDRLQPITCPTPAPLAKYLRRVGEQEDRDWVAIKDVAWTLDPKIHQLVYRKPWVKPADGREGDLKRLWFERLRRMAEYLDAQLDLIAEMCLDRSCNCIAEMELTYTYEICIAAISQVGYS